MSPVAWRIELTTPWSPRIVFQASFRTCAVLFVFIAIYFIGREAVPPAEFMGFYVAFGQLLFSFFQISPARPPRNMVTIALPGTSMPIPRPVGEGRNFRAEVPSMVAAMVVGSRSRSRSRSCSPFSTPALDGYAHPPACRLPTSTGSPSGPGERGVLIPTRGVRSGFFELRKEER